MIKLILTVFLCFVLLSGCASVEDKIFNIGVSAARSSAGFKSKSIMSGDHKIAYLEREAKGDTIVLLHGFAASKDNWLFFVRRLPKEYRVIAFDMPAHGDSTALDDKHYNAQYLTQGISQGIDALNLQQFHIAGNSLGGYVSTLYTAQHPDKVMSLGLFDGAGVYSPTPSEFQKLLEKGDNPLVVNTKEGFDRLTDFIFYKKPFIPRFAKSASLRKYLKRSALNRRIWEDIWANRNDVVDLLPQITMPVFILWGDKDRVLDVSGVEVYKHYLPNANVVILKDCGHAPMIERTDETARAYLDFLKAEFKDKKSALN